LGKRSTNGKRKDIVALRAQQTATIDKILDGMKHHLPTVQEIVGSLWDRFPEK
jgi:hypothetical protein